MIPFSLSCCSFLLFLALIYWPVPSSFIQFYQREIEEEKTSEPPGIFFRELAMTPMPPQASWEHHKGTYWRIKAGNTGQNKI